MKIIVDTKNYTPFKYDEFLDGIKRGESPYEVGQVVVCDDFESSYKEKFMLGVILGCISHKSKEVRTDVMGMTSYDKIRPANIEDFENSEINCTEKLKKEVQGFKVKYNWKTDKLTIK